MSLVERLEQLRDGIEVLPQRVRLDVDVHYVLWFLQTLGVSLTLVGLGLAGGYAFAIGVVMDASSFEALPADVRVGFQSLLWYTIVMFLLTFVVAFVREKMLVSPPPGTQFIAPETVVEVEPLELEVVEDPRAPDDAIPDDVEVRRLGPAVKRERVDELREHQVEKGLARAEARADEVRRKRTQDGGEN